MPDWLGAGEVLDVWKSAVNPASTYKYFKKVILAIAGIDVIFIVPFLSVPPPGDIDVSRTLLSENIKPVSMENEGVKFLE